jgi:hypothetical protein
MLGAIFFFFFFFFFSAPTTHDFLPQKNNKEEEEESSLVLQTLRGCLREDLRPGTGIDSGKAVTIGFDLVPKDDFSSPRVVAMREGTKLAFALSKEEEEGTDCMEFV